MSLDHVDLSSALIVNRWRRYGHDRAYVKLGEQDLGYRDLKSGDVRCEQAQYVDAVTGATEVLYQRVQQARPATYEPRHSSDNQRSPAAPPVRPRPAPTPRPLAPDVDLARNMPGQSARARAEELRAAAPIHTLVARLVGVKTDERAYRIGADGEEEIGLRWLPKLGPGWHVLHAVPVGGQGSDIDHVVVGPAGVFTVNVKHHPQANVWVRGDTFKINNFNQPYIRNSRYEAARAARLLSAAAGFDVDVRGMVVVMGARRGLIVVEQPRDGAVTVVGRKQVVEHLQAMPPVLGMPSVERIYAVARHLATWQPKTVGWQDFESR